MIQPYYNFMFVPFIPPNCEKPPTLYSVLNSIVNGDKDEDEYTSIKDLAKQGRGTIFNFDYPLSSHVSKEDFETMILKHYMMRRIGFETVTAFRINLDSKLNEIMPLYNKMLDAIDNWNIFENGEVITREGTENTEGENSSTTTNELKNTSETHASDTSDRRHSDTPQDELQDVRDGKNITDYNYDQNTNDANDISNSIGNSEMKGTNTNNNEYKETITHTPGNKIEILKELQENVKSIYTLIFKDLDILFYGLE